MFDGADMRIAELVHQSAQIQRIRPVILGRALFRRTAREKIKTEFHILSDPCNFLYLAMLHVE